ncbi:MAG: hypothetical protein M3R00_06075 [Pseudomonadota bacterium]|nr:hypothetical protein [Pseudomonadota bacterium]
MKQLLSIAVLLWMAWSPVTCWAKSPLANKAIAMNPDKSTQGIWGGSIDDDDDDDDGSW